MSQAPEGDGRVRFVVDVELSHPKHFRVRRAWTVPAPWWRRLWNRLATENRYETLGVFIAEDFEFQIQRAANAPASASIRLGGRDFVAVALGIPARDTVQ